MKLSDPRVIEAIDELRENAKRERDQLADMLAAADAHFTVIERLHDLAHETPLRVVR